MKLYSIWCNDKQRFFRSTDWTGREYWSKSVTHWRTIDGVEQNLRRIGSEYRGETFSDRLPNHQAWLDDEVVMNFKRYANFDPRKLQSIEVIICNVEVLGETRIAATDLMTSLSEQAA